MKAIRCWRAPKWSPLWLRRRFPGCWTRAEFDGIWERAHIRAEELRRRSE